MKTINCTLIGGGKISEQHLVALKKNSIFVAGICELSPALARFTADRFGVPRWYTDYKKMLEETEATVVHVLTPPATHDKLVRDCLTAGKHVIIEKPVALSNDGFRQLWNLAVDQGVHLIENHNYRFNTPITQLKDAIAGNRIGRVEEVEIRIALNIRGGGRYADKNFPHPSHQLPAGIIHEFITHLAYLLLYFMPDEYETDFDMVQACWRNYGGDDLFKYDNLDAILMAGAAHGRLRFSCRQWPDCFTVIVHGSDGMASVDLFNPICQLTTRRSVGQHLTPLANAMSGAKTLVGAGFAGIWNKVRNRGAYEGLERFLALTYAALHNGEEPPVTYQQMDAVSRLVDRLLAEENRI
jgi:predicted dehydrogenase